MQTKNNKPAILTAILLALSSILFSFISPNGGDSFTIYLNNKLVVQQFLYGDKEVKSVSLGQANQNDELRISFSHCGQVGKNRSIAIKDEKNKVLKQWTFADNKASMICKVKDILDLNKGSNGLFIFYSSNELRGGQVLASVITSNKSVAKN